ncbi:hypothetical protein [Streptomyces sp. NPDC127092]|uniref:hypothetical protein n=1 Tax=Streptomyces sp. NPDC127092 TaxID=3347135 RepID=UPI0036637F78
MRTPGFERPVARAHPVPETPGTDRLFPQLESYCSRECRVECGFDHDYGSPEWAECFDLCMETCR